MIVFFDIGSTLIDGPSQGPGKRIADLLGRPELRKRIDGLLFRTNVKTPDELGELVSRELNVRAEEAVAAIWRAQLDEAYVLPGAREAVARLREAGIPRGYISNIWPPFYHCFERHFPEEAACPRFLSFELNLMKPDIAFYRHALEQTQADEAVMVGDTYRNDIVPAAETGMRTVWLLHRPAKETHDIAAVLNGNAKAPDLTLESIAQLTPEHICTSLVTK